MIAAQQRPQRYRLENLEIRRLQFWHEMLAQEVIVLQQQHSDQWYAVREDGRGTLSYPDRGDLIETLSMSGHFETVWFPLDEHGCPFPRLHRPTAA